MVKDTLLKAIHNNGINEAFIMMYFYDKVVMGRYHEQQLFFGEEFEDENLMEYHIFNSELEIRGNKEKSAIIKDTKQTIEEKMFIVGNQSRLEEGKSCVTQNGRRVVFPFEVEFQSAKENPLRLIVRHLFDDKTGSICGYRLVGIEGVE